MGGGSADRKRTQWLGFLLLRKTERTNEFVEREGELERKRLCVCSFGGWSMAREPWRQEALWLTLTNSGLSFFV